MPSFASNFGHVVGVTACFITLFFLTRGEAYESPVRTKASRLKSRVKVTTACNCP